MCEDVCVCLCVSSLAEHTCILSPGISISFVQINSASLHLPACMLFVAHLPVCLYAACILSTIKLDITTLCVTAARANMMH